MDKKNLEHYPDNMCRRRSSFFSSKYVVSRNVPCHVRLPYVQFLSVTFKLIKRQTPSPSPYAFEIILCRPAWLAFLSAEGLTRDIVEECM